MIERILTPEEQVEDLPTLRPRLLRDFVGQSALKDNLSVYIQAAKERRECLDHILLSGPPGLGKTTLAYITAREMQANLKSTAAPAIEKTGDMAALLSGLQKGDVLFVDEIHRLKPVVEEILYSAMEDHFIDITLGQGLTSKSVKVTIPPFTFIGATTRPGSLTQPLLSRFGILLKLEYYEVEELNQILRKNAEKLQIRLDEGGYDEISRRSRGTPRILNRLVKRVRDFAQVENKPIIDRETAEYALSKMKIDASGLDQMDRKIVNAVIRDFGGGPVGLDNLATFVGEDTATLEDMIEPYLIQKGLLKRSPRGRMATSNAYKYFHIQEKEPSLFNSPPSVSS